MTTWTDDQCDWLRKLAADGLSAGQIAKEFGGISRNAVLGKLFRLGVALKRAWPPQTPPVEPRKRKPRRGGQARALEAFEAIDLPPDTSVDACTLMELTAERCRYPLGDPGTEEFRYCGTAHSNCGPYCTRHSRIAYRPYERRRVAA